MRIEKYGDDEIRITECYLQRESIKDISGRRWDAEQKAWIVPLTEQNLGLLKLLGAEVDESLAVMFRPPGIRAREVTAVMRMPIKAEPYAHQVEAFNFATEVFRNGKGTAFLMDMGTGKTITTIAVVGSLAESGKIKRLLVVCPKSIVGVWEEEFAKFADYDYRLAVLEGDTAKKADTLRHMAGSGLQIVVVNYESCWRLETELAK